MSQTVEDELWPHFVPLWIDLRKIAPGLLLAGGYALFLKQRWLVSQLRFPGAEHGRSIVTEGGGKLAVDEIRTLVAAHRWKDQAPRVTKDFDLIANLDLIASESDQSRLDGMLKTHDFKVVPANARWQFEKKVGAGRSLMLDFHAPSPAGKRDDLRVRSRRVKPHRSLGQTGIHGRENAEATCSELHPFTFLYDSVNIVLPNPVTLAWMKLVAMSDRRLASQNPSLSAEKRREEDAEARKHAEDVCRVMAMMTREESETASNVLDAVSKNPSFGRARTAFGQFFDADKDWVSQVVAGAWQAEDFEIIQTTLADWFH